MQEHDEDKMKLNFVLNALASDPFEQVSEPRADIQEALKWQAARTPAQVIQEREALISTLEAAGAVLCCSLCVSH